MDDHKAEALKLNELQIGASAILGEFSTSPLHLHLLAMGLAPGMKVTLVRRFPMRGGLYLQIGKKYLVMRNAEAGQIEVSLKPDRRVSNNMAKAEWLVNR